MKTEFWDECLCVVLGVNFVPYNFFSDFFFLVSFDQLQGFFNDSFLVCFVRVYFLFEGKEAEGGYELKWLWKKKKKKNNGKLSASWEKEKISQQNVRYLSSWRAEWNWRICQVFSFSFLCFFVSRGLHQPTFFCPYLKGLSPFSYQSLYIIMSLFQPTQ